MTINIDSAEAISRWGNLGVTLPEDLAAAIALFESVQYADTRPVPVELEDITAENVEAKLRELAEYIALSDGPENGGYGLSPMAQAKNRLLSQAATVVVRAGTAAVPSLIEQMTPAFDARVELYVEAIAKLPDELTSDTLVRAGGEAVEAY